MKDAQAIETHLTQVHNMVTELHQRQEATSSSSPIIKAKDDQVVSTSSERRYQSGSRVTGSVPYWGSYSHWRTRSKNGDQQGESGLRFPLTVVRPLKDNEFLQKMSASACKWTSRERIQRNEWPHVRLDLAAVVLWFLRYPQHTSGNVYHGPERQISLQAKEVQVVFTEKVPRKPNELRGSGRMVSKARVKQEDEYASSPLDDYFCKGMDTSGPASWEQVLRRMADGTLPDVGCLNSRVGVREEKWTSLALKPLKFPSIVTSSVRRATLIQNFEADFIRAMGIISPLAALYAQAVIAGVQRDLPVYRRRDVETTQKHWTARTPEEQWHSRAEAAVNLQLQNVGIAQECWDLARMLRHDPPMRLILMTAYHRRLPAKPREEDDLAQYVKEPVAGDQGAVSTFQKLQEASTLEEKGVCDRWEVRFRE